MLNNILPLDGEVYYHGCILSSDAAEFYFNTLLTNITWKADEAIILGKHIITKRKTAWYADKPFIYTYSKITRQALPWTAELLVSIVLPSGSLLLMKGTTQIHWLHRLPPTKKVLNARINLTFRTIVS